MKDIPKIVFEQTEDAKGFELLSVTHLFARIPTFTDHNPTQAHRLTFFALLMVTKGKGKHQIDLKEYDLSEGSVLKIAKGQVHAFQKDATYEGFLLIFTEEYVLNYFSKSSIDLISHLYNYHISSPIAYHKTLNEEFLTELLAELQTNNTYAQNNIVAALLDLYLLRLERNSTTTKAHNNNAKQYTTFLQFKNLVESNYTATRNVKDYANTLLISTKYLNQVVKRYTLNTAKSFIDNYVTLEVKRAIASTEKSLKEIAFDLGFDEVTNFTKFFKKHTAVSPKQFKNSL
ncbi:helix-turn-helix transcriptional regulator [Cellulophaga sp. F20128]|uniref:helix-turn-helix domain-containing protein n=1 Tax=Cellulophaga sp. F20128 TaxID=2926413 RepID=UPI001FF268B6|nr:helix-turn-helix domain-containing protein [Cellulophaga sp. F20128]MCK0155793.1 helix-turn-helix transcriptional regulator [Cellulophaga sp. F20128]